MKLSIIIPTYCAEEYLDRLLKSLSVQTVKPQEVIIIDSSSPDRTVEIANFWKAKVIVIPKQKFDHGETRTLAGKAANGEVLIYITQDVMPCDEKAIENLIKPFYQDKKVGATFGRQIPYPDATLFAKHLRLYNYPDKSYVKSLKDKEKYGLKTCFCSNSFAAYRKSVLEEVGWFKSGLIFGEDMHVAAKILLKGYKIAYVAEAKVYHSHSYTVWQEFKRYFDIGVFHKRENWILKEFGKAEGGRYVKSEFKYLLKNGAYHLIPEFFIRNILKFLGYKLGYNYDKLPKSLIKKLSMHSFWWDKVFECRNKYER
ncbi:MAG: glycosyltransferase family 2 protein [Thermodesulfobacteria bacterium]|nr:glycosyltransferase family 2 protein [Thermodesulfobacteriota bacterium]